MTDHKREIEEVLYTYAERVDAGDFAGVGALFRHGCILPGPDTAREHAIEGSEAVCSLFENATIRYEDGTPLTQHVTSNVIVEIDLAVESAAARSRFTVYQAMPGLPLQAIACGRYRDTFRRIEGKWWFDTRTMSIDLVGDMSRHLRDGFRPDR